MTDIVPVPNWGGVRQLETNEYATGGLNGNMNEQAKSLAGQNMYSRLYAGLPFDPAFTAQVGGFPIGGKAALENGDIVRSTVANNTVNPNVDMTGWVKTNDASQIFDANRESQQDVNDSIGVKWRSKSGGYNKFDRVTLDNGIVVVSDVGSNTNNPNTNLTGWFYYLERDLESFGAVGDGVFDCSLAIQDAWDWVFGADGRALNVRSRLYKCKSQIKTTVSVHRQNVHINFNAAIIDLDSTGGFEIEATGVGQLNTWSLRGGILRNGLNPLVFKALSTLRYIYGFSIVDTAVEAFSGNGISFLGNIFELQLRNPAGNAKTTNTTGYGLYFSNSTGGTISSVDIFGGTWRNGKHGLFVESPVQDLRIYGGTYLRAQEEGVRIDNAVGIGVYGCHVEQNWVSGISHNAGQAGMRVSGYGDISGVCGYNGGNAWQTSTLRVYASSGGMVVSGGSKNGTSQYNVHLSGSATANLTLLGAASKDYFLSGSIAPNIIGDRVKGRLASYENFVGYAPTVSHNLLLGSYLRVGDLTGDVTISNPTGGSSSGDILYVSTKQDSVGGRIVSWGSEFKGVASSNASPLSTTVWAFIRIGSSSWVQVANSSYT